MNLGRSIIRLLLLSSALVLPPLCLADSIEETLSRNLHQNKPIPTKILVRVVAHGSMVLGKEVGGARVTITDVAGGKILASGLQMGEAGDQNQIMRTPHVMGELLYSSRASASFTTTIALTNPTLVEISAEGPLAYPAASQRASERVWLIPGHDLTNDGIVLTVYGYIVQLEQPNLSEPLIAKSDVLLRASIRTLSGSLVRPYGDWDSRKVRIYGEVLIGEHVHERLQMFYSGQQAIFEAPFFVPLPTEAPEGVTLRVVAVDPASGNSGIAQATFPILSERLPEKRR